MNYIKKEIIPIFFATDDKYCPLLIVAIESIVAQASKKYRYHIHILTEDLSPKNRFKLFFYQKLNVKIYIHNMKEHIVKQAEKMHTRDYYSKATYFRVYIANLFPQYHKALYIDCDVALNADISDLYNFDIGDNYIGAITCEAVDTTPEFTAYAEKYLGMKLPQYFNAGILVMNLDVLRKVNFEDKFFDILSKVKFEVAQDQDYLNVLCRGKVVFLPKEWNKIPRPESDTPINKVKLVHYNLAFRPWRYDNVLYGDLFWKHARNTSEYETLLEMKRSISEADMAYDEAWMENLKKLAVALSESDDSFKEMVETGKIVIN